MSTEKLTTAKTTDNSLSPSIEWFKNSNFVKYSEKAVFKNVTFTPPNIIIFFMFIN